MNCRQQVKGMYELGGRCAGVAAWSVMVGWAEKCAAGRTSVTVTLEGRFHRAP
jgi:hypothetical protein